MDGLVTQAFVLTAAIVTISRTWRDMAMPLEEVPVGLLPY